MEQNTRIDVAYIAKLAKLELTEEETNRFSEDLNQVLAYVLVGESGPDHDKQFQVEVKLNGRVVGTGVGKSKKRAEQMAAQAAMEALFPQNV